MPLIECNQLIEQKGGHFTTFHPNLETTKPQPTDQQINSVKCLAENNLMSFEALRVVLEQYGDNEELEELIEKVRNFVLFAGPAASQIVLMF